LEYGTAGLSLPCDIYFCEDAWILFIECDPFPRQKKVVFRKKERVGGQRSSHSPSSYFMSGNVLKTEYKQIFNHRLLITAENKQTKKVMTNLSTLKR
jgi:hypothetical protein